MGDELRVHKGDGVLMVDTGDRVRVGERTMMMDGRDEDEASSQGRGSS